MIIRLQIIWFSKGNPRPALPISRESCYKWKFQKVVTNANFRSLESATPGLGPSHLLASLPGDSEALSCWSTTGVDRDVKWDAGKTGDKAGGVRRAGLEGRY